MPPTAPASAPTPAGPLRRTPPAIFPPILGLFAVGLAWRAWFAGTAGAGAALAELFLGAVAILYAVSLATWLAKPLRRPGVVATEIVPLPGLAGLAAACLSGMLLAAVLAPRAPGAALAVVLVALLALFALALGFLRHHLRLPPDQRAVTPVWHLLFVGPVVSVPALVALGLAEAAHAILAASALFALAIWTVAGRAALRRAPPPPLRPLLAIHLAPASVLTLAAAALGLGGFAALMGTLAAAMFTVLLVGARWITAAGFSPLWGAFTFPLAAFAGAMIAVAGTTGPLGVLAGVVLVAASLVVPAIAWRVLRMWTNGKLAQVTNAAIA